MEISLPGLVMLLWLRCYALGTTMGDLDQMDITDFEPYISPEEISDSASKYSKKHSSDRYIIRSGKLLKNHVRELCDTPGESVDLAFLVDNSATVGKINFRNELNFVRKLLANFTVSSNKTRVTVITFASSHQVVRHIDFITKSSLKNHKCDLLDKLPKIQYSGGGTYTLGAMVEAQKIFIKARPRSRKALFLITDGYSNGGDPRIIAERLKHAGVEIFTFGIRNGNVRELRDMATSPKAEHSYFLESFDEFEALARRALHEDIHAGEFFLQNKREKCNSLCDVHQDCCDVMAHCACGTKTGHYQCLCAAGHYGTGIKGDCVPCPEGFYKSEVGSDDVTACIPCPDRNHWSPLGSTLLADCKCKEGYESTKNSSCLAMSCPKLKTPSHGYFVKGRCDQTFHTVCGIKCKPGYALKGSSLRICQSNRQWSGQQTICKVKRCRLLKAPRNGRVICSSSERAFQSSCQFACHDGYFLLGSRKRKCMAIAMWDGIPTRCRAVRCRKLPPLENGRTFPASCLHGYSLFDRTCQFTCKAGYTLVGPSSRKCSSTGHWSTNGEETQCIDTTPPVIQCPSSLVTFAEEDESDASVMWNLPTPWDNSGQIPSLRVIPAVLPPHRFSIGKTLVKYIAKDRSQNLIQCSFDVTVLDNQPPRVDSCVSPDPVVTRGKQVYVNWTIPLFTDNSGETLKIERSQSPGIFPLGISMVVYKAMDNSGNNNTCTLAVQVEGHPCSLPNIPESGNVTCEQANDIFTCKPFCLPGNDFFSPPPAAYTCTFDGSWKPQDRIPFPDCSDASEPLDMMLPGVVTYISGTDCYDTLFLKRVESGFRMGALKAVSSACGNDVLCHITEISTNCVPPSSEVNAINWLTRYRRSLSGDAGLIIADVRNTSVEFLFTITASILDERTHDNRLEKLNSAISRAKIAIRQSADTGLRNILSYPQYLVYRRLEYFSKTPIIVCRPGRVLRSQLCLNCPVGMFYNVMTEQCDSCERGTYQPKQGQYVCLVCPLNMTTTASNSKDISQCKAQCLPGTFSFDGLELCQSCDLGFYQPQYAQNFCNPCPYQLTTWIRGARKLEMCKSVCPKGYASRTGIEPCFPCPLGHFQPDWGQTACFICPEDAMTFNTGSTGIADCLGVKSTAKNIKSVSTSELLVNDCFAEPCENGAWCESLTIGYTCHCTEGYTGINCELETDECTLLSPCKNNATCVDIINGYNCECQPGFEGTNCEIDTNDCLLSTCHNGAGCIDELDDYKCVCLTGFRGVHCEEDIDECATSPCRNGATCHDRVASFACICPLGFTGKKCEIDINECQSLPCTNNATCVDKINEYRCSCLAGFAGKNCEMNIDECLSAPCVNGAECIDGDNSYKCICAPGFTGKHCKKELPSDFILTFGSLGSVDYVIKDMTKVLSAFTVTFWLRTTDQSHYGTVVSYASMQHDNALTIMDYNGFVMYVNGKRIITDIMANDGTWHHVSATWNTYGEWHFYLDGILEDYGEDLAPGTIIHDDGKIVLGQEQDIVGGGFSMAESYVGHLTLLNIWNITFSEQEIFSFYNTCKEYKGNVFAWSDFQEGRSRHVVKLKSNFCKGCSIPQTIEHGLVSWQDILPSSTANYSCDIGYDVVGHRYSICMLYSEWSSSKPVCQKVSCGKPNTIKHGYFNGSEFTFTARVFYFCNQGFYLKGNISRVCLENGGWSGAPPSCERITCEPPTNKPIWRIVGPKTFYPGSRMKILCHPAYIMRGRSTLSCGKKGKWNAKFPICIPSRCVPPPIVPDAFPINQGIITSEDKFAFIYQCVTGYRLLGSGRFDCFGNLDMPVCKPVDCGSPLTILNAKPSGKNTLYKSVITYYCNDGFTLTGHNGIRCHADGSWSEVFAYCTHIYCPNIYPPENGFLFADKLIYGATASYGCKKGYELIGDHRRFCQGNGTWSGKNSYCKIVRCSRPENIHHGTFSGISFTFGAVVTYICDSGYSIDGNAYRKCTSHGKWNNSAPICKLIRCPDPINVENSRMLVSGYHLNDKVTYFCTTGYKIERYSRMMCGNNSKWIGTLPKCLPVECPQFSSFKNGHYFITGVTPGSRATFYCETQFLLIGNITVLCTEDGIWSQPIPSCHLRLCPPPPEPEMGFVNIVDENNMSVAEYSCESEYSLIGEFRRFCLNNGSWAFTKPICRKGCPDPPILNNLRITQKSQQYNSGAIITYICPDGFILSGSNSNICIDNIAWSNQPPTCKYIQCAKPSPISNGKVSVSYTTLGSKIIYKCNLGFYVNGSEVRTCCNDSQWDNPAPKCLPMICPTPVVPLYGFIDGHRYFFNSTISYRCQRGYNLSGSFKNFCNAEGIWTNFPPICKIIQCNQRNLNISNGSVTKFGIGVTEVLTFSCNIGYNASANTLVSCSESGKWNANFPTCNVINCGNPPLINFGSRNYSGKTYGHIAQYKCVVGFSLVGPSFCTCSIDSKWTDIPFCKAILCNVTPDIHRGSKVNHGRRPLDTTEYSCDNDYVLVGDKELVCDSKGKWHGIIPGCITSRCEKPIVIKNGHVIANFSESIIFYICKKGHKIIGSNTNVCERDGIWEFSPPTCVTINCTLPPYVANSRVSIESYAFDSTANYSCVHGYFSKTLITSRCLENGSWSKLEAVCQEITCPRPSISKHSYIKNDYQFFKFESKITYLCKLGFKIIGQAVLECTKNGSWSAINPICHIVTCPPIEAPRKGVIHNYNNTFSTSIKFSCLNGFLVKGNPSIRCQYNGKWSASPPLCKRVKCPMPPNLEHGYLTKTGIQYEDVIHYKCRLGYKVYGNASITCLSSSKWNSLPPICRKIRCQQPESVNHGNIIIHGHDFGNKIRYHCNSGYVMIGTPVRYCFKEGRWSGSVPRCKLVKCLSPKPIQNGQVVTVSLKRQFYLYDKVVDSCIDGFVTQTNNSNTGERRCLYNGQWSASIIACKPVICPLLSAPNYGVIDYQDAIYGGLAKYSCQEGYIINGSSYRICSADLSWSGQKPSCNAVECPKINGEVINGYVNVSSNAFDGVAKYSCDYGFELSGNSRIYCQADGKWSALPRNCVLITCPSLDHIANGYTKVEKVRLGDEIEYKCQEGYELVGESNRTCLYNKTWSGRAPKCRIVICGPLTFSKHLFIVSNGDTFGSTVEYGCAESYELVGPSVRSCLANKTWSGPEPSCRLIECSPPPEIMNGYITAPGYTVAMEVQYHCQEGYKLSGSLYRHCKIDKSWSGSIPQCNITTCPEPSPLKHGIIFSKDFHYGSTVHFTCNPGYRLVGNKYMSCTQNDGKNIWDQSMPRCVLVQCPEALPLENGYVLGRRVEFGSILEYRCNSGYKLVGVNASVCLINDTWDSEPPKCFLDFEPCGVPPDITNGDVVFQKDDQNRTTQVTYKCRSGFFLEGEEVCHCVNGKWATTPPICVESYCGPPPKMFLARTYITRDYYSLIAEIRCHKGYETVGRNQFRCSSSGLWAYEELPFCRPVECGMPLLPEYLTSEFTNISYLGTMNFKCIPGFLLVGSAIISCLHTGLWSNEVPECEVINCGLPEKHLYSHVSVTNYTFNGVAMYFCNQGLVLNDTGARICQENGYWSREAPFCIEPKCYSPKVFLNGRYSSNQGVPGDRIEFQCNAGYILVGPSSNQCLMSGKWQAEFPTCKIITCSRLPNIPTIQSNVDGQFVLGDRVQLVCASGFGATKPLFTTCQYGGTWSSPTGGCTRVSCGKPRQKQGVWLIMGRSYLYGDSIRYVCYRGLRPVQRSMTITCQANGKWNGIPRCVAECKIPCQHGGTCISINRCACAIGYSGSHCETANCLLPCLNGGTCVAPYRCRCLPGYLGLRCQKAKCDPPCENGGTCSSINRCSCLRGWRLPHCKYRYRSDYRLG